jgi:hypothetical protein
MIPVHLQIWGFFSYYDPVYLDFKGVYKDNNCMDMVLLSKYETPKAHKVEKT